MFWISNPAFYRLYHQEHYYRQLINVGWRGELYYFTKSGNSLVFNMINSKVAFGPTEDGLRKLDGRAFELPLESQVTLNSNTQACKLLSLIMRNKESPFHCRSKFHLFTISGTSQKYLCVAADYLWSQKDKNFFQTSHLNLHFIDIDKKVVEFTAINAELIVHVKESKDRRALKEIMFVREKQIVLMDYGQSYYSNNDSEKGWTYHQTHIKSYSMMPAANDQKPFTLQINQLYAEIENHRQSLSYMHGRIHQNGRRITLIYTGGGVYTFDLKDRKAYQS